MPSKTELAVAGFYDGIFRFYEAANSFLTLGLDRWWRSRAAKIVKNLSPGASTALDVCAGTGDFSIVLYKTYGGALKVTGSDLSRAMLSKARSKTDKIEFVEAEAKALPFADGSFDLVTISFGIRNFSDPQKSLENIYKVLKPGGRALIMEFALPKNWFIRKTYFFYFRNILPFLGNLMSGHKDAYSYLNQTVEDFPHGESFKRFMNEAGFANTSFDKFTFGIVNLYKGDKI